MPTQSPLAEPASQNDALTPRDALENALVKQDIDEFKAILDAIPQDQRLKEIKEATKRSGFSILHQAAERRCRGYILTILDSLPEDQRLEAIQERIGNRTVLECFAEHSSYNLLEILKLLPEQQRLCAIQITTTEKYYNGTSIFYKAGRLYPEKLSPILTSLPDYQRFHAIKAMRVIDMIKPMLEDWRSQSGPALIKILATLSTQERLQLLKEKDYSSSLILHTVLRTLDPLDLLKGILTLIPSDQLLEIITLKEFSQTAIHLTASRPGALKLILASLPTDQHLSAITAKDSYHGHNVFHCAILDLRTDSLKELLNAVPDALRFTVLNEKNNEGYTVFDIAAADFYREREPSLLKDLLESITPAQRLEVMQVSDSKGETMLQKLAKNPRYFKTILALLPKEQSAQHVTKLGVFAAEQASPSQNGSQFTP